MINGKDFSSEWNGLFTLILEVVASKIYGFNRMKKFCDRKMSDVIVWEGFVDKLFTRR